jgi:hypothetical protein
MITKGMEIARYHQEKAITSFELKWLEGGFILRSRLPDVLQQILTFL